MQPGSSAAQKPEQLAARGERLGEEAENDINTTAILLGEGESICIQRKSDMNLKEAAGSLNPTEVIENLEIPGQSSDYVVP